jgi:predicted MFS family arabinose efflux permease
MALAAIGRLAPPEKRGEYIGLASAGGSLGQAAMVPIVYSAIGWVGAAGALATLAISACSSSRSRATSSGGRAARRRPGGRAARLPALARRSLADRDFALLTGGFFACGFQLAFLTTHLPSHIALCGLPTTLGMTALMLIGLFNIPGSWFCGWLSSRMKPELALGWIYLARTLSIAAFAMAPPTAWGTMIFAAIMGFVWLGHGAADLGGHRAALRRRRPRRALRGCASSRTRSAGSSAPGQGALLLVLEREATPAFCR